MSTLAFTIWYNDLVILDVWLKYYSQYFDALHVICSQTKPENLSALEERKKIYKMTYDPPNESLECPTVALFKVRTLQGQFLKKNEWVLCCNCDEILAPDPNRYKDLAEVMKDQWRPYVACECFEVIEWNEPPIDFTKPLLKQRTFWVKNIKLNKILLGRVSLDWNEGQHQIPEIGAKYSELIRDSGLYMIHLRHFNLIEEEKHPRDFGPYFHSPNTYVLEQSRLESKRLVIPQWAKELI